MISVVAKDFAIKIFAKAAQKSTFGEGQKVGFGSGEGANLTSFGGVWQYLLVWFSLISTPFLNFTEMWGIIPVYLDFVISMIFMHEAEPQNAVWGGATLLWVAGDWIRNLIAEGVPFGSSYTWFVSIVCIALGVALLILGLMGNEIVGHIARGGVISYFSIMLYPLQYGLIQPSWPIVSSIFIFFPIIWGIVEITHLVRS